MLKPVVFDLDDFCEEIMNPKLWNRIFRLKYKCPNLKITMFTVPLKCSEKWLSEVKDKYPWIEMHYHGLSHEDKNEWFGKTNLELPYSEYFFKGFKAPWWRMDQKTADWFNERDYVISGMKGCFQVAGPKLYFFNEGQRLLTENVAYLSSYRTIHSHVQHQKLGDGLPDIFEKINALLNKDDEFLFISELF